MNNVEKIKPSGIFTNYIYKAIPLAFDESMSYYETLCGVLEKLKTQEEVINNNADLLLELENFVIHYFDNLDVQEEINNKLDAMAESGELTDIIAQYLQLAGLLCFNTKANLKAAQNLVDGSFAKTFGTSTYNDGYGYFYKIRTLINTDVIDDNNLIALTNYPTLVAEKMPDAEITALKNADIALNTRIDNILSDKMLIVGDSFIAQYQNDNWATKLRDLLGLTTSNCTILGEGGAGVYQVGNQGTNFKGLIQANINNITEKDKYKKVVIGGGTNDVNATSLDMILSPLEELVAYIKSEFPNAKIYFAEFGWFMKYDAVLSRNRINHIVIPAYKQCTKFGAYYLYNTEYCYRDFSLYDTDDPVNVNAVHPNDNGQKEISQAIFQALNGCYNKRFVSSNIAFPTTSDVSASALYFTDILNNGRHIVNLDGNLTVAKTYTNNAMSIDLGILGNPFIRKSNNNLRSFARVPVVLYSAIAGNVNCTGQLSIDENGHFKLRIPQGLSSTQFDFTQIIFQTSCEFDSYEW